MRRAALAQELEELDALAQPALHHLRAADHFADDRGDLAGAEIEAPVEFLDRVENFACATDADNAAARSARRRR